MTRIIDWQKLIYFFLKKEDSYEKKCLRMILKLVQRIWVESVTPVSYLPFVYVSASQPEGGELGICGIVITVLCYILVVITFPFSLFFCLKVSHWKALDCIDLNETQWSLVSYSEIMGLAWVLMAPAYSRCIWDFSLSKYGSMQWVGILRDFDCGWDMIEVRPVSWEERSQEK